MEKQKIQTKPYDYDLVNKMKKAKTVKINPVCPVRGCRAQKPHTDDPLVRALMERFKEPDRLLGWVQNSLGQLYASMCEDFKYSRHFGWITRLRQIEELYFKALYITFLIPEEEVPHWLSGDTPNSISEIYKLVNDKILKGKGKLTETQEGIGLGDFTAMKMLHSGGHVDYKAMQQAAAFGAAGSLNVEPYFTHVRTYIDRIDYMRKLFEAGRDKLIVLQAIINMHTPLEELQKQTQVATAE